MFEFFEGLIEKLGVRLVSDFMTKEIKNILKKDLKKYESLVNITEGEAQDIYMEVVMFFQELINE